MALVNIEFDPEEFVIKREDCTDTDWYDNLTDSIKNIKYKNIIVKRQDFVYESWDANNFIVKGYEFKHYDYQDPDLVYNNITKEPIRSIYGVCDNIDQIFERDSRINIVKNSKKDYVILIHWIPKENNGGWRWHKWGTYIGDFEHNCEYLSQETTPGLNGVWIYNVQQVNKK